MSKEKIICSFKLPKIQDWRFLVGTIGLCYHATGNKFSFEFNGSKGYLSNIEISCEGVQKERNNIIWIESLTNKNGTLKSKLVSIYHSEETGVRVEVSGKEVSNG